MELYRVPGKRSLEMDPIASVSYWLGTLSSREAGGEGLLGLLDAKECWRLQLTEVIGLLYKTGKS